MVVSVRDLSFVSLLLLTVVSNIHSHVVKRSVVQQYDKIWPSGNVVYQFSTALVASERSIILEAMSEIQNVTVFHNRGCISFHEKAGSYIFDTDYIFFHKGQCQDLPAVGQPNGREIIYVNSECLQKSVMVHYLLRVLGMYDEHTRSDRDTYIDVHFDNIADSDRSKFTALSANAANTLGLPYDFKSITHFGPYDYAKDPTKPTITGKVAGAGFGQKLRLSVLDVKRLEMLYRCKIDTSHVLDVASLPVHCDFEGILCNLGDDWRDNYEWSLERGPVSPSGPSGDHSNGNGYFAYVNGSSNTNGGVARLISAWEMQSGMYCIQFAYNIQGNNSLSLLSEDFDSNAISTIIDVQSGINGSWTSVNRKIVTKTLWRVIIEAKISDPAGGVAIDDISVMYGDCQ